MLHGLTCVRLEDGLERTLAGLRGVSELLRATLRFPQARGLELRVSGAPEINARVFLDQAGGSYVIEFTLGLIVWADVAAGAIAFRAGEDSAPLPPFPEGGLREGVLQDSVDRVSALLPQERLGLWERLFQTFLLSVFAHEAAHIVRGHVDYQGSRGMREGIDELGLRRKSALPTRPARLIEFDADAYAARIITHLATSPPAVLAGWGEAPAKETLVFALIGSSLFFAGLEHEDQEAGARSPSYPTPLLRLIVMLAEMDRRWARTHAGEDFYEVGFETALSTLRGIEAAFPRIGALRELTDRAFADELLAEANAAFDQGQELEAVILAYAFDGEGLWPAGSYD